MKYHDSHSNLDTPKKILKVNHAGEFGAISIYKAQLLISKYFMKQHVPMLQNFIQDETKHKDIFWAEIQKRNGVKCKSYWLCGVGGYVMGAVSSLLGTKGIMACTWAVESVVINHLHNQIEYLATKGDEAALVVVKSILEDEVNHRDTGFDKGGTTNIFYAPLRFMVSSFTELVIRFGMR
jgi:3-demethoxyubiquinol 3-hydroxylase